MQTIDELTSQFPQSGTVEWIGIAREARGPIVSASEVFARPPTGIDGEHHAQSGRSKRQVTLIQAEHLPVVAALLDHESIEPELLRRNMVVSGINLVALKDRRFQIGEAVFQGSGPCPPCSRMEENLGQGGMNAMRGHGGITARVVEAGAIRVGDAVRALCDD